MNNECVLKMVEENKREKESGILGMLKPLAPLLREEDLLAIYIKSISIHQSAVCKSGDFLESKILVDILDGLNLGKHGMSYERQVAIDKGGVIVGFGGKKKKKCHHVVDFVVGTVGVGRSISDYIVISCKTTCRERWTQDAWSHVLVPKLYILLTMSDGYPPSERFAESASRKIITCKPKKRDDRTFKLGFEDLGGELLSILLC